MNHADSHPSDEQLLRDVDGELSRHDEKIVRTHLEACWQCRARRHELQNAITDFVHVYRREFETEPAPISGPRALLKARLAELSAQAPDSRVGWFPFYRALAAAALCAALVFGLLLPRLGVGRPGSSAVRAAVIFNPDSRLTPGATLLVDRPAICEQPDTGNKTVPPAVRQKVFAEYGIRGADPREYEVDYLVTPALGGADDIHNLWPHSYSATVWNAHVKDALEDRLRQMVCNGDLDLAEAQREIAANWIVAYKKYFHTETPLTEHCGTCSP